MSLFEILNNGEWQKCSNENANDFNPNTSFNFNEPQDEIGNKVELPRKKID